MDNFFTAIKNQVSFNKMLESQLQQLANVVPANQGKIPGQPKDLETANLVDIFNAGSYWSDPISKGWNDETLPIKKGDSGRPVILISIGNMNFNEAIYDFDASVNIMPKVIYDKIFNYPLLYTTMCLQLAHQSLCYTKGILEDICVRVGSSYIPADFVVIETGGDEKSPIILRRPFLNTLELSCMPTLPRSVSTSKARERPSSLRIECCSSLHTLNIPMSQGRRTIGGTRIIIGSHNRWSQ
jgi:hypothetical protein